MHIYVFFSMWFITGYRVWFPVLYSWALLFIGITHASLHLPVPNSQSIRPHPPSSLASIRLFSVSVSLFHRSVHLCHILDSTCQRYHMVFVSVRLISLSMITSCLVSKSCLALQPHGWQPARLLCPWDFPGRSTGVGSHFLLRDGPRSVHVDTDGIISLKKDLYLIQIWMIVYGIQR